MSYGVKIWVEGERRNGEAAGEVLWIDIKNEIHWGT